MADTESLKWFASMGVGGILAAMVFYYFRLDRAQCESRIKEFADTLLSVVTANTQAITINTETIKALHKRIDDEQAIQDLQKQVRDLIESIGRRSDDPPPALNNRPK